MADIQTTPSSKHKGVIKCKKLSTRVDLTPMVDLGFLLITFFIFTTSLSEPKVTKLVMPSDKVDNNPIEIANSKVLQVLLSSNDKIYYFNGADTASYASTSFGAEGIRKVIINKQKLVAEKYGKKEELVLMIKPLNDCNYKNVIDILDEVQINNIKHYVFSEATKDEKQIVKGL
jgi:biopolymer transport protein ExbD